MFDKVLQWPEPIDSTNWRSIDPADLYQKELIGDAPQLLNFATILSFVKDGLEATEDKRVYSAYGFVNSHEQLVELWITLLRALKDTAQSQSSWLQAGMWNFQGNQVGPWSAGFDASFGGIVINDPYISNDIGRHRDFGKLFEIGKDFRKLNAVIKGGSNSALTKQSIEKISQKGQESIDDIAKERQESIRVIDEHLSDATKERLSQIKAAEVTRDWSVHYDKKCKELEESINGNGKKKGLKQQREIWYTRLMVAFGVYALIALLIAHGWWVFKLNGALSESLLGFGKYFIGLTFYGVLAGVYMGYAFASRQLKVHQNLLEQYKHRSVVAKTIEGVIYTVVKSKDNPEAADSSIREKDLELLVQVAATSMFEYRPIGHLSTREASGGILGELFGRN